MTEAKSSWRWILPGAYSMSPFTSEESITSSYVRNERPDVIVNIVDATNLSRSLFFTTQLLELGVPVVVALNKSDLTDRKQTKIDEKLLSEKLGCPVIKTVSTSSGHDGLKEVVQPAVSVSGTEQKAPYVQEDIDLKDRAAVEAADRKRLTFVNGLVSDVEKRKVFTKDKNFQDKIDSVITHKIIGIPIFAVSSSWYSTYPSPQSGPRSRTGWSLGLKPSRAGSAALWKTRIRSCTRLLVDGIIGGVGAVVGFLPLWLW